MPRFGGAIFVGGGFSDHFLHPEKYTIAPDTRAHFGAWRKLYIKCFGVAKQKHYKTMYEGLLYGDPKSRVLRILYTQIFADYNDRRADV